MNIEGVNLLSLLPGNSTIEGGMQSLLENGTVPEGFTHALMGQLALLSEANGQVELPEQLQSMAMPQAIDKLHDIGDLLKQQIKLLNETNGQVELPGQLQSMTMPQAIDKLHDISDLLKNKGDEEELAALFDKYLPLSDKENEAVGLNEDIDLEAALLTLTDALKAITPDSTPDEMAAAQNTGAVMAFNGLSFVKPLSDEAKLNMPGEEDVVSGDFLQKEAVLSQATQDKQSINLPYVENAASAEKTLVLENQASPSGIEQEAPGVTSDMIILHRQVDNRTDSPAITRPLTHPGWSKDLGEQIVWMNNKAIPAAEIRLNPAHLGPISVRIDVSQDQATIMFTAQHTEVKEAIEASIPKLREMLGTHQLNLSNVNISQNSTSDQGRSQSQAFAQTPENREQGIDSVTGTIEKNEHDRVVVSKGLLSIYA